MVVIDDLKKVKRYKNPVLTIGNFDGVHLGHRKIFRTVIERAGEISGTPMAMTFNPHPTRIVAPERDLRLITSHEDKVRLIEQSGIKVLICVPFDREFSRTDPGDFIRQILVERLGVRWVIVGPRYAFGKNRQGSVDLLRRRGRTFGFGVTVVRYEKVRGDAVSSSRIRSLLMRGRVLEASRLLGRPYHINGTVITGAGRGAPMLNTPTANLRIENDLLPKEGVYAVRVSIRDPESPGSAPLAFDGVANIGSNPTFGGAAMSYEVHLLDFSGNLLGRPLRVHFIDRLRDERKFPSSSALRDQIAQDVAKARALLGLRRESLYL
jgi:riboflavin kinase/FMN adenylyltransferase